MEADRLSEFVRTDYPRVVAALGFAWGDRTRAEDAVQEALAAACESRHEIGHLRKWVTTTALNQLRSQHRRFDAERRALDRVERQPVPSSSAEHDILEREQVLELLSRLPTRQREVVALHYLLDMSVREVAEATGVTEGTVKTQLHRARDALRTEQIPLGSEEETDHVC